MTTVFWFRRDLRLGDNPALLEACASGGVLPLFVLDPVLWGPAGPSRRVYLSRSLRALDASLHDRGARLNVLEGDPAVRVVEAAREIGATRVHLAADYGPYGHRRDRAVEAALLEHGIETVRTGSPYAVAPGRVSTGAGQPFKVYTPYSRAWAEHGWRRPVAAPDEVPGLSLEGPATIPDPDPPDGLELPEPGEVVALERWRAFLDDLDGYGRDRNRPDLDATSRMSAHLKWGEIHPRTMLADLAERGGKGAQTYRRELAWREFYADVLFQRPDSARDYLRPAYARMRFDEPGPAYDAWREGRTGFPIVDAGMRQLRATGWMHNRVRMIAASFLVKDLHLEWQHGARHFMRWLVDGDLASNQHGWQWTAGTGTDAAPYYRVFNPTTQGRKFDPEGAYVRHWVAELADPEQVPDPHDPGTDVPGYPGPLVDHAAERREALDRLAELGDS